MVLHRGSTWSWRAFYPSFPMFLSYHVAICASPSLKLFTSEDKKTWYYYELICLLPCVLGAPSSNSRMDWLEALTFDQQRSVFQNLESASIGNVHQTSFRSLPADSWSRLAQCWTLERDVIEDLNTSTERTLYYHRWCCITKRKKSTVVLDW
jgi:hypothetical protein